MEDLIKKLQEQVLDLQNRVWQLENPAETLAQDAMRDNTIKAIDNLLKGEPEPIWTPEQVLAYMQEQRPDVEFDADEYSVQMSRACVMLIMFRDTYIVHYPDADNSNYAEEKSFDRTQRKEAFEMFLAEVDKKMG